MVVVVVMMMVVVMLVVMMIVRWSSGSLRPSVWPLVGLRTPHTSLHTLSLSLMVLKATLW